jgi:hypothetical protein
MPRQPAGGMACDGRNCIREGTSVRGGRPYFQAAILAVLPNRNEEAIPPREIFWRLGVERPTPSQRASLSRSLSRLAASGLVIGVRENIEARHHDWRRK